ncbi:lytic transglycosylase domain-containing protein [uncultured Pelagimonas sp.]|uniref:lytic transglycosylase domain-containing protein n=1 Tax=uncultured Pelagimonas sp. TaxID=1618102 RepID=UPI00260A2884|nr:lytic transglycosylase domain-containing protein [uncultured Pelagimonas sp.]
MSRVLVSGFLTLFLFATSSAVWAQDAGQSMARAMEAMRQGNWAAARIEARGDGQAALDVILWHALRAGRGDAVEVQDFLARNGDWPGLSYLKEKSEAAMSSATYKDIRSFYDGHTPQTGTGALSLARAWLDLGEEGAAQAEIVLAWRTLSMSGDERRAFLENWGEVLADHHVARLDYALWKGWSRNAGAMVPFVDEGWQALAEARLALRNKGGGVDTLIEKVPAALQNHPGLAFERFMWRVSKRRDAEAIELLLDRSESAEKLGEPWAWARARRDLARKRMRAGAVTEAYNIASSHHLVDGSSFADLEWLSGYLALRFLDKPDLALQHFTNFRAGVWTPISLGRAGYWIGRAHEALGDTAAAQEAYGLGAQYQTSFYGLLAAERGGIGFDGKLDGSETFPDWRSAEFTKGSVFNAGVVLLAAGEISLAERFLTHLAESQDRVGMGQIGHMLRDMRRPHIQVMLGKRAAKFGFELAAPYYAVPDQIAKASFPVPKELVLAISRRESEFDPGVISGAGARGYMQLMPGTAKEVSDQLGLEYSKDKLLSDPAYNATLGSTYLATLSKRFGANAVMMSAGYNAGPSRPIRWMELYGDPRKGEVDVIDFIEFIPFDETRNYVMRVSESLPVYRARLGQNPHPVPFSKELIGSTLPALSP